MKPHLYFWQGRWWVSRNGRLSRFGLGELRAGRVTLNDIDAGSFRLASGIAQWVQGGRIASGRSAARKRST